MFCKDCEYLIRMSLGCYRCSLGLCPDTENNHCYMLRKRKDENSDNVKHPSHYADTVPEIECIQVTQHFNFNKGNAIKYIWRAGHKNDEIEDLKKAIQYLEFEIRRLQDANNKKN